MQAAARKRNKLGGSAVEGSEGGEGWGSGEGGDEGVEGGLF